MYNYGKYDDIINLPHHESKKHPRMSKEARAAQFAPFAALTGYDEVKNETSRLTTKKKEGGKYITVTGNVIKIDEYKKKMILENNIEIPISEIIDIL